MALPLDLAGAPRFDDDPNFPDTGSGGAIGPPIVDIGAYEFERPATDAPGPRVWAGGDGNFADSGKWLPGATPDAGDTAVFDVDETHTVTVDSAQALRDVVVSGSRTTLDLVSGPTHPESGGQIIVGPFEEEAAGLTLSGGRVLRDHHIHVHDTGAGALHISDGTTVEPVEGWLRGGLLSGSGRIHINPIKNHLADLRGRLESLRGYL